MAENMVDSDFEYVSPPSEFDVQVKKPEPVMPGQVSQIAKERNEKDAADLLSKGFDLGEDTVFAIGTRVAPVGDANQRLYRQEWEQLPSTTDAMNEILEKVTAEKRQVLEGMELSSTYVDPETGLFGVGTSDGQGEMRLTKTAQKHLASFLSTDTGLAGYLPYAPAPVKHDIVSHYTTKMAEEELQAARDVVAGVKGAKLLDNTVNMAVKMGMKNGPLIYRVASKQYKPFEVDTAFKSILANEELGKILQDSRAEVLYDGEVTKITMLWHSDEIVDKAAGDVFKVGIQLSLDDIKSGSIKVIGIAYRNLCMNYMIIGRATKTMVRQRHAGLNVDFAKLIGNGITQAANDFVNFRERWGDARRDRILDGYAGNAEAVFQGLVAGGLVHIPGRTKEAKVEALMNAYNQEPGPTRADLVNAITRAAHETPWYSDLSGIEEVETEATQLVYVRNLGSRIDAGIDKWTNGW